VSGQRVYKPIRQVTPVSTAAYEVLFRRGRIEAPLRKVTIERVDKEGGDATARYFTTASLGRWEGGKVYNWVNRTGR